MLRGDSTIAALQVAANRYASIAQFAPIAVDGVMGNNTEQAVIYALGVIHADVPDESDNSTTLMTSVSQTQLTASASGFTTYLNQNADTLNLPSGSGPTSSGLPMPAMGTDISMIWATLPTTVKVGAGILAGVGILAIAHHFMGKHKG